MLMEASHAAPPACAATRARCPGHAPTDTTLPARSCRPPGTPGGNVLYAEFQSGDLSKGEINFDQVDFTEYYNIATDPWQMNNLAGEISVRDARELHTRLHMWLGCAGDACP